MKLKLIATLAATSLATLSCAATQGSGEPETAASADSSSSSDSSSSDSSSSSSDSSKSSASDDSDPVGSSSSSSASSRNDDDDRGSKAGKDDDKPKGAKGIPMPVFPGLKFGMSLEQIAKLNDKELDAEYKKKFAAASPSASLQIEDELRDKKAVFRRSRIEFLDTPTGIDQSALKGEYTYANKESLARMTARTKDDGKEVPARNFFFFNDKLWKIYEEYKLGPKSNLGADFDSAVKKLSKVFGAEPKKVPADFAKGQSFDEAQWVDGEKIIRAIDRGDTLGMAFVEKASQDNLAKLRTHQVVDQHELDKDVKAATANPPTQISGPPKKEDEKKDAKKGGKK
jgi:hypothetical protein